MAYFWGKKMLSRIIFGLQQIVAADHRIHQLIVGDSAVFINKQKSVIQYPVLVLDLPTLQVSDSERSETQRERTYSFDLALLSHAKPDDWERMRDTLVELEGVLISLQAYLEHGIYSYALNSSVNIFGRVKVEVHRWQNDVVWEYSSDNCVGWMLKVKLTEIYCVADYMQPCNFTALNWSSTGSGFSWNSDGTTVTFSPMVSGGVWLWRMNSQNTWQESTAAVLVLPHGNVQNNSISVLYRVEAAGVVNWYRVSVPPQSVASRESVCGVSYPYLLDMDSGVLLATAGELGVATDWQGTPASRDFWVIDSSTAISVAVQIDNEIVHWQLDVLPNTNQYLLSVWYNGNYQFTVNNGSNTITI